MKRRFTFLMILVFLSGCSTLSNMFGDDAFDAADKLVHEICKLDEGDRLPIREKIMERYGVDTSGVCQKVRPVPASS